jgi:muramoyltetrapeptide carboxypeptidase
MKLQLNRNRTLTVPAFLQKGDTIGIATPASPYPQQTFEAGIQTLKQWGFKVINGRKGSGRKGYLAGTDLERAGELMDLFTNPEVKGIICSRGGYGSMRVLDHLDFKKIIKHPKVFMGFSDITVLLMALWKKSSLMTFHGPMITTFPKLNKGSLTRVRSVLSGAYPLEIPLNHNNAFHPRSTEGILLGGNLTLLVHLIGTPYEPVWDRAILFLEDCGEAPYRIDRLFSHLKLRGALEKVSAILVGQFTGSDNRRLPQNLFKFWLGDLNVPVWTGLPIGHGPQNIPLPVGAPAFLDSEKDLLSISL